MKNIKYIATLLFVAVLSSCSAENDLLDVDALGAPTNISALTTVTQDNTGKVTILPRGEGVTQYEIYFGDGTAESVYVLPGATVDHIYKEGVYDARIIATTVNGKKTEVIQNIIVSFKSPENLVVTIENDLAVSKKVNVTATADYALFYDVYFGEVGKPDPIAANNGETLSYTYANPGVYTIRVVSKSAAIKSTEKTQDFTVTLVNKPFESAPTPPNRQAADIISIYGSKYTAVAGTNYFPDWNQGSQGSSWTEFDLNGDKMLNYIKLSYQGIALADGTTIDVSGMEYLHMDVWTADLDKIETSLISKTNGEKPVVKSLVANQWTSLDIPISAFTSQGLTVADIFQLKFVGIPWATGSVFIDNIYFYKSPSATIEMPIDFESTSLTYPWAGFGASDYGAIPVSVITNPDKSGINVSNKVLKIEKAAGAQTWAGASLDLDSKVDFSKGTKVKMAVWSPEAGAIIMFKTEVSTSPKDGNGNPTVYVQIEKTTTVANAWEIITFDLTTGNGFNTANAYDRVILFPDFNVVGKGATYYFDDIKQAN
tara:strand:- start:4376 stop:6001 length:1626 start_codon:yes stop_codon:yes gene_type:complete